MFNITELSRNTQRVVCAAMAVFIVFTGVSLFAYGAAAANPGYSVTISQIS